jgi:hypothetical protein
MRKSAAWSAVFLAAIVLGLCGRSPLVRAGEPFGPAPNASPRVAKPPAASSTEKSAGQDDPWGNFDMPPEKASPTQPQCVKAKPAVTAKKSRPRASMPAPQPSRPASMKITVGKASNLNVAAELAASEEIIEKALSRPVTLDVVETPLDKVAEQLSRQLGVNVAMDRRALNDVGMDPATPVTCKATNVPLRFALDEFLRQLDLTWTFRNGALLVTTPEEEEVLLTTKVYDVSSLLVEAPDCPAGRSSDLGDPDSLFGQPSDRNMPGGAGSVPAMGWSSGGGMNGLMMVGGQPGSPPILQQEVAALVKSITSNIEPTMWEDVGGACKIVVLQPQQLLVVNATRSVHQEIAAYLDTLRRHVESRPQIRIEAHWLWLTESELTSLLGDQDKGNGSAGDVIDEGAWKKLLQEKQKSRDEGYEPAEAFGAILKGQNGQLISGVSGRQTRVVITLIPVVGDPPVTVGGVGMGGMGPGPAPTQMPAPPVQATVPPPLARMPPGVGYQPVCRTIQEGGALEVRPCVVAEGKEILLDLHSRFVQRDDHPSTQPQAPATGVAAGANGAATGGANGGATGVAAGANGGATGVAAGANGGATGGANGGATGVGAGAAANVVQSLAAAVDRPVIYHYRLESTLRVPAGRRVLAGGLSYSEMGASETNLYLFVKATVIAGK